MIFADESFRADANHPSLGQSSPGGAVAFPLTRDRWLSRGALTIADQGLFTLTNFGLNLLLARWLLPDEYGAFAIAFALFFLIGALHLAVLTEPVLIFGGGMSDERLPAYLNAVLYWHWRFASTAGLVLAVVGLLCWLKGPATLAAAILVLTVAGPCLLFLWLLRNMCYVRGETLALAVLAGGIYLTVMISSIAGLFWYGRLSAVTGIGIMGIASGATGLWLSARLGVRWRGVTARHMRRWTLARHWQYGRWSAATYAFVWIPENLSYLLLSWWGGLGASAAFRGLMNFLMPFMRMQAALVPLLLTTLVRSWTPIHARYVRRLLAVLSIGAMVYWMMLGMLHQSLLAWVYDGQYQEYSALLWLLGMVPLSNGVSTVLSAVLRAQRQPEGVFWAHATAAVLIGTVGVGLVAGWGVTGAAWAIGLSGVVTTLMMWKGARQVGWGMPKGLM